LILAPDGGVQAILADAVTARVQGFKVQGLTGPDGAAGAQGGGAAARAAAWRVGKVP
jgi:hypothetical protein